MYSVGARALPASSTTALGASRFCSAAASQLQLQLPYLLPRPQQRPRPSSRRRQYRQPGGCTFTNTSHKAAAPDNEPAKEPTDQKPSSPSISITSTAPTPDSTSTDDSGRDRGDDPTSLSKPATTEKQQASTTSTTTGEPLFETNTTAFVQGGRTRAWKGQKPDSLPPTSLPDWFMKDDVKLWHDGLQLDPLLRVVNGVAQWDFADIRRFSGQVARTNLLDYFHDILGECLWTDQSIMEIESKLKCKDGYIDLVSEQTTKMVAAAAHITAALSSKPQDLDLYELDPRNALGQSTRLFESIMCYSYGLKRDVPGDEGHMLAQAELMRTIRTGLLPAPPNARDTRTELKRPVSVATCLNYEGSTVPRSHINIIAFAIKADVVHLDALSVAEIAGAYLGQTNFWSRGEVSGLGYDVMERNGRSIPRYSTRLGEEEDEYTIKLPRLFSTMSRSSGGFAARLAGKSSTTTDERWDELKLNRILEDLVKAAETKRSALSRSSSIHQQTIIHVHNFVELSLSTEGEQILNALRTTVDRLWQKGQRIVLVGSSAFKSLTQSSEIRFKVEEIGRQDCHMVPTYLSETQAGRIGRREEKDVAKDNLRNIRAVLTAMAGSSVELPSSNDLGLVLKDFSATVYDAQWAYRIALQLIGENGRHKAFYSTSEVVAAIQFIRKHDLALAAISGATAPYYSPLAGPPDAATEESQENASDKSASKSANATSSKDSKKYDDNEKKLLPNLINAEDIKVTFDDIICPTETKESLQALTSLSLTRPEAFLYGILASERIPGCLLYGPPGTGKTMIAKAIAKQSGANMLDISSASINDMWVGNSEKNVRALFSLARKLSPCVIFIDEGDSMLGNRGGRPTRSGHREVINQFLREWDGLKDMRAFILVATNRPFDIDDAVLRRLPRKVLVDLPLREARLSILKTLLKDEEVDETVNLEELAAQTELYSGSDLKNVCVAAALEAVKEEVRAKNAHIGAEPFEFPDKRILSRRHIEKGLKVIGPSISEDMTSLKEVRKFDERYGDAGKKKRRRNMGFQVGSTDVGSGDARIRQPVPA